MTSLIATQAHTSQYKYGRATVNGGTFVEFVRTSKPQFPQAGSEKTSKMIQPVLERTATKHGQN